MRVKLAAIVVGLVIFTLSGQTAEANSAPRGGHTVSAHAFAGQTPSAGSAAGRFHEDVCMPM
ncbi:hypothetical protein [Streptomyces sp. NPDC008139]|uniref:hypothetical protein n=1 Tax=Streptomyces sp. NPDC008139 TaxID=3364814 RepID=UPI0036E8B680